MIILLFSGFMGLMLGIMITLLHVYFSNVREEERWKIIKIQQKMAELYPSLSDQGEEHRDDGADLEESSSRTSHSG
jgi:hypothetical protein